MQARLRTVRWWALLAVLLAVGVIVSAIWMDNLRVTLALGFAAVTVAILSTYEERP